MKKRREIIILIILILILFLMNYSWTDPYLIREFSNRETAVAMRIVDGDTIAIENNTKIRLLGINTPEKGEKYYAEAKSFLENMILNKTIEIESGKEDVDKYNRSLRYVFSEGKNANLELVKNGLANAYYPTGKDRYAEEFYSAWNRCLEENRNLCEKSKNVCVDCIQLKEFDCKKDKLVLYNNCGFDCTLDGWTIKDEGRKKFVFGDFILKSQKETTLTSEDFGEDYVWTKTGDSLFLRDDENKLVLYSNY